MDAVRVHKQGFPFFLPLAEFRRRFRLLAGDFKHTSPVLDERKAVEDVLMELDLELSSYRVGLSQVRSIKSLYFAGITRCFFVFFSVRFSSEAVF